MEDPPPKYFRLAPGREVRLRYAYFIKCDERGQGRGPATSIELRCTYDPATRGGDAPDGRKVKATLHWVSAAHALEARCACMNDCSRCRTRMRWKRTGFSRQPEPELA